MQLLTTMPLSMILAGAANPLNASELIFPTLECIHILGFAMMIGSIAILDFRVLGYGLTRQTTAELYKSLSPWTWVGMAFIFFSGPLMYSSDPDMYYLNWAFLIKMICLAAALVFHFTVRSKTVRQGTEGSGKAIACVSLLLWGSVVFGGIFIGFVTEGL